MLSWRTHLAEKQKTVLKTSLIEECMHLSYQSDHAYLRVGEDKQAWFRPKCEIGYPRPAECTTYSNNYSIGRHKMLCTDQTPCAFGYR